MAQQFLHPNPNLLYPPTTSHYLPSASQISNSMHVQNAENTPYIHKSSNVNEKFPSYVHRTQSNNTVNHPPHVNFDFKSPTSMRKGVSSFHGQSFYNDRVQRKGQRNCYSQVVHHEEMVPKRQYEKCVESCRIWEQKFNELYSEFVRTNHKQSDGRLQKQNMELRQRVRDLQKRQKNIYEYLQANFGRLVQKYQESTIRECTLLTDRYRLERKYNEK